MKKTIRRRFFVWLGAQTVLIFGAVGVVLFAFNLNEQHEHPTQAADEIDEGLAIATALLVLFPLAMGSAWLISRRLLRPWRELVAQAQHISAGHVDERIVVPEPGDEIGQFAAVLNTALDNYQSLLDRLHRFSFDAAHQLRNPLAAIRTSGEVALARLRGVEEYQAVIGGMLEDAQRLSRTVEQLLMLARAAQGGIDEQRERFAVLDVVRAVVEEARLVGESRDIALDLVEAAGSCAVRGVRELLRQALTNVIDNALRFSPDGGRVEVAVRCTDGRRVRISVTDGGPGLTPEQRAVLFRPFARQSDRRESVGLGLAIAADICKAHAGAIGVESESGGGCVFWLEFPTAA